jgi:ABC-2 type transport system permease protein
LWAALLCGPGYFLYAFLAAGLGLIAGDQQQARQLSGLLGFLGLAPLYFMGALVNAMDGPLAIGLTWFPLTAPVIALFRLALTQVPVWQLIVSLAILILSLAASIWFVARIFRSAMLLYGQSLRPKQIWQVLWQA